MKKIARLGTLTLAFLCIFMLAAYSVSAATLTDIQKHWAKEYVEYGVEKGYISGYEDGTFLPDKTVSRAEFSKMINSAIKLTSVGEAKAEFKDVKSGDWFFNEVKKAENAGYITGYAEDGTFRPNNPVTRQEAAVILSRLVLPIAERANINSFSDGDKIDTWAVDAVTMIAAKGYIKGDENKNFNSKGALTRGQAAKLICEFVKNENIVNKNQTLSEAKKEITYSETLFTDDVVIAVSGAEDVSVVFKNCRILGSINIKTEGATVKLENTKAKNVYITKGDVTVEADKSSEVKNAYVEAPATLAGDGFKKVVLSGENLSEGLVKIDGNVDKVEVSGDALVTAKEIKDLTVTKKVSLVLQAGTVKKLTVESAAKGSTINLAKKVVVEKADNKAAVSYIGSGTIKEAANSVSGVEFDGVVVEKTTGKKDETEKEEAGSKNDGDFFKNVEVDPENKKTKVAISKSVSFTFLEEVLDKDGNALTTKYVKENFKLTKSSAKGTAVSFDATVANGSKKVVIDPVKNLDNGAKYYVVIPAGTLTYKDGATNEEFTTYFTTIAAPNQEVDEDEDDSSNEDASVTMSPKSGSDDVSVNTSIKLTFDGTLKAYSGTLDEEYIEEEAIKIYEGSTSGDEVNFTASISSKTITLNPSRLLGETKYYVVILGNKLKVGGSTLSKTTMSFTTEEGTAISISPENGASGVSTLPEITVSFAEPVLKINGDKLTEDYIQDNVVAIKEGSTKDSAEDVYYSVTSIAENGRSFVIVPDEELEASTTYYIIIEEGSLLGETNEEENAKVTSSFKTASAMAPMFTPYDGKEGVSVGTEIKISFSGELLTYTKDKKDSVEVDDAYLDELINGYEDSKGKIQGKNRITLKRVGASKPLAITATIDADGKTIIITPEEALIEEKEYTISIEKNLFYSLNGTSYKANTSGSATFSTNVAMSPAITPKNDADDVAVTVNPTIKFNETELYRTDDGDKKITGTYLKNNAITFVDQYDNEVEFSVELSGSTITVVPEEDLEGNVEYTLTLVAGTIANADGVENSEKSVTFTTKISYTLEVTPSGSKTGVSPFVCPTVKFGTEVFTVKDKDLGISEGDIVDEEYASKYIFLTEGTKSTDSDDAIPATIEIGDDGRTFTIIPEDELDFNTKYYINVVEKKFLYADEETKNKASSTYFTTIKEPEITKIKAEKNNSTSIKITYTSNVADSSDDKLAKLVVEGGPETKEFNITSTKSSSVTIKGLEKETDYTFTVYIVYDGQIESEAKEVTAST